MVLEATRVTIGRERNQLSRNNQCKLRKLYLGHSMEVDYGSLSSSDWLDRLLGKEEAASSNLAWGSTFSHSTATIKYISVYKCGDSEIGNWREYLWIMIIEHPKFKMRLSY